MLNCIECEFQLVFFSIPPKKKKEEEEERGVMKRREGDENFPGSPGGHTGGIPGVALTF